MLIFDICKLDLMKVILIVLLIIYALVLITRLVAPLLLKYALKKLSDKFNVTNPDPTSNTKEKQTTSQKKINSSKKVVGEYIDFEEID